MMELVRLADTDLKVSRLGFGCYQLPLVPKQQSYDLINIALENGINFFETARDYRDSEERLGKILHSVRDKVVIATKMGSAKPLDVEKTLEVSLRKLQTDYVDIYSMEGVNTLSKFVDYGENILPTLKKLKKKGIIRYIGMTSHNWEVVERAMKVDVGIDVFFSPANIMLRRPLQSGIPFIALKPFGGYKYYYMQCQDVKYIADTSEFTEWFSPMVALNYLFQFKNVESILCGFTEKYQVELNCEIEHKRSIPDGIKKFYKFDKWDNKYCDDFFNLCGRCSCESGMRIPFLMRLWKYYDFYDIVNWTKQVYNMMDMDYRDCGGCGLCDLECPKGIKIRETLKLLEEKLRE